MERREKIKKLTRIHNNHLWYKICQKKKSVIQIMVGLASTGLYEKVRNLLDKNVSLQEDSNKEMMRRSTHILTYVILRVKI